METDIYKKIVRLNTLGQKHLQSKNYSSSIIYLKSAEELVRLPFVPHHYKSLTYLNLATYYLVQGQRQKSIKYLEKILKIGEDKPTLAKAYLNIGHIYSLQGYHQKSLYQNLKALKYLENTEQ